MFHALRSVSRPTHGDARANELGIVLVRCNHFHFHTLFGGHDCQGADDVVGLKPRHFDNGNAVGLDDILDIWYRPLDVFRGRFALCLVFGIGLMSEGSAGRVERHGGIVRGEGAKDVVEGVDEAEYSRGILTL